jgi:cytoplasmic iron level regulating protein YaaA (DUF328/UPF0246 family)
MRTLCIVSCGEKKIWNKKPKADDTKAKDVYIGLFSKKCQEYAKKFYPQSWCILSAKYGFLHPDDLVSGPYNVTFKKKSTNPISQDELSKQIIEKGLNNYDRIVVLGGKDYVNIIKAVFPQKEVHAPLIGCRGNGEMMKKLNDAIQKGVPL